MSELYEYGIIYENLKGKRMNLKDKREAIVKIESVCPCCRNKENIKVSENKVNGYRQYIYSCDKCETSWRGNCYDENEDYVAPERIIDESSNEDIEQNAIGSFIFGVFTLASILAFYMLRDNFEIFARFFKYLTLFPGVLFGANIMALCDSILEKKNLDINAIYAIDSLMALIIGLPLMFFIVL